MKRIPKKLSFSLSFLLMASLTGTVKANSDVCKVHTQGKAPQELIKSFEESSDKQCSKWFNKSSGKFAPKDVNWRQCCINHDIPYWKGGTQQERLAADKALADCVASTGSPTMGQIMYVGVRNGGHPNGAFGTGIGSNNTYRWGYGWRKNTKKYGHSDLQKCVMETTEFEDLEKRAKGFQKPVPVYQPSDEKEKHRMSKETGFFNDFMKIHSAVLDKL